MARRIPNPQKTFIQKLIKELKTLPRPPRKILVAVSGGVDSVGLLLALHEVKELFKFELSVGHVHHGDTTDPALAQFRDSARQLVQGLSHECGLEFFTNLKSPKKILKSEAELRKWRYDHLTLWSSQLGAEAIALGHHQEDLLETQMMRLMRGSAGLGLGAMTLLSPKYRLRPFLHYTKAEIQNYVQGTGKVWAIDPSNSEGVPLRNQLRVWLNDMEQMVPGAKSNLLKSLHRVVELHLEQRSPWKEKVMTEGSIIRPAFMALSLPLKRELLAHFLRAHGIFEFTSGQIIELMKRLDVTRNDDTFNFFGRCWTLSPEVIQIFDGR